MNVRAHDHVVYMPSTMTYSQAAVKAPVGTSRSSGLETLFANVVRYIAGLPRRHAVKNELNRLSDRELADIGLSRSEIAHVFSRSR